MRLFFMLVRRVPPVPSPVLSEVFDRLQRRGFTVESGIAEEMLVRCDRLRPQHDLYILKSHTELSLSLAEILHSQGAAMLNPYASCIAVQDKIAASRRLCAANIPTPRCWVTEDFSLLKPLVARRPLIIKPYRGHRGVGVQIVREPDDLERLPKPSTPVLIQEYIPGNGLDVKVYVVGKEVFAVSKPFSPLSFTQSGRPYPVAPELRAIALRCGEVFGLGLYGLDVIESPAGPVVVDLNYFPGYKGVPDVAPLIADYIEAYAEGRVRLQPPARVQVRTDGGRTPVADAMEIEGAV